MSESEPAPDSPNLSPHDSPDGESFLELVEPKAPIRLVRQQEVTVDPYLESLADYAELVLNDDRCLDIITEGGNTGLGQIAASVRAELHTADTFDVIALAPRVMLLKTEFRADKIWDYISEALDPDGTVTILEYHETYELTKPDAEELFEHPLFRKYLTPWGQGAYQTEPELASLGELISGERSD